LTFSAPEGRGVLLTRSTFISGCVRRGVSAPKERQPLAVGDERGEEPTENVGQASRLPDGAQSAPPRNGKRDACPTPRNPPPRKRRAPAPSDFAPKGRQPLALGDERGVSAPPGRNPPTPVPAAPPGLSTACSEASLSHRK
jgi:hypothetical protein